MKTMKPKNREQEAWCPKCGKVRIPHPVCVSGGKHLNRKQFLKALREEEKKQIKALTDSVTPAKKSP